MGLSGLSITGAAINILCMVHVVTRVHDDCLSVAGGNSSTLNINFAGDFTFMVSKKVFAVLKHQAEKASVLLKDSQEVLFFQ